MKMKIKLFDVVELNNKQKAIIKKINKGRNYLIEIVSDNKTKKEQNTITDKDITKVIYSRNENTRY